MPEHRFGRIGRRVEIGARFVALGTILGLAVLAPTSYVAVHQSSTSDFCNSCHIMEPYHESWGNSAHSDITCIECHFDPGTMGTLKGKFQALTQLTKYVTRTAGTRPWAHVSDASCLQCHALEHLEGPLDFDGIAFDHGPHLLELRGHQLQCVTCHSQVLIDDHFTVQKDVCYTCHFMPAADGVIPEATGDCRLCHDSPTETLEVAGAPFVHDTWVEAGVDCRACHADAVAGTGRVLMQRCKSCHGQPELIAQITSPDVIHRAHVTDHKVECFECHVEITHGLAPTSAEHAAGAGDCGSCHATPHEPAFRMYAGTGAIGVEDQPSRMRDTRVTCEACHTGRLAGGPSGGLGGGLGGASAAHARIAVSGEVDCLHCHGVAFGGMLAEWQGAVGGGAEELLARADELRRYLDALESNAVGDAGRLLSEAEHNLALVRDDGSRGAHNVTYALDTLRAAAERIDGAWAELEPGREAPSALAALPPRTDAACSTCHVAVAAADPLMLEGGAFQHASHLGAGLACSVCHLEAQFGDANHGLPAFSRDSCVECHHTESELVPDPTDCSSCHATQIAFLEGTLTDFDELLAGVTAPMAEKGCENCHGEPPDIMNPSAPLCALCHDDTYAEQFEDWRTQTAELVKRLELALFAAAPGTAPSALDAARRALDAVAADGSHGAHAFPITEALLRGALEQLEPK